MSFVVDGGGDGDGYGECSLILCDIGEVGDDKDGMSLGVGGVGRWMGDGRH